jgi:hypothetical protein
MVRVKQYQEMKKIDLIDYIENVCKKLDIDPSVIVEESALNLLKHDELVQLIIDLEGGLFESYPDDVEDIRAVFNDVYTKITGKEVITNV